MSIDATLRQICELQPQYSSDNTPAMQERGRLVRNVLRGEVFSRSHVLQAALGEFGDEFILDASDGIGRKTQAPWVRFSNRSLSPNPRTGFYAVLHFAADGSAVFVTVGCSATVWSGGDLRALPDDALRLKTQWAQELIKSRFGGLEPFTDEMILRATAPLPRAFEKATAFAKRVAVADLSVKVIDTLLISAAERLRVIYAAQRAGSDLTTSAIAEASLESLAHPNRARVGQGFRLSSEERRVIEKRAMTVARQWLEHNGYAVVDTSANSSVDFEAVLNGVKLKVEVKGSTAAHVDALFMTKNEVELHRREKGQTALFVVAGINVEVTDGQASASGGTLTPLIGWDIDEWEIQPMAYQLKRRLP